jgi:hypothetical protein
LLDVSSEDEAVHRTIDYAGRRDPASAQSGDESGRFPVAVGQLCIEAFPAPAASATARHVCRGSSFINEYKPIGINPGLIFSPGEACLGDIRPVLLGCEHAFF